MNKYSDTELLEFIVEHRLSVKKWHRNPVTAYYSVTNEDEEQVGEGITFRIAIKNTIKAMGNHG